MPTIPLPVGPPKRRIIEMAYGKCGLAGYELGRTPEEVSDATSELNAMMLEWPFCCLGYEQPDYGLGSADDLSGIPNDTLAAVATQLALRLAPNMGKTLSPEAHGSVSRSMAFLHAKVATIPTQTMQNNTPRGMGKDRGVTLNDPFINEDFVPDDGCVIQIPAERGIIGTPAVAAPPPPPASPPPPLLSLALSANSILENSAAGTVVGAIQNAGTGSTLSLSDSAGSRFAISGGNLVAGAVSTDYESATSHSVTIVETLVGAFGSPKSTTLTIAVGNVFEQPSLGALAFSATTFLTTAATSGTIIGATAGSTIAATGLPAGLTINGPARTWAWDGTGSAATASFTLTETLADSANSPRVSTVNYSIVAAPGTLQVLTLSASSIAENSAAGTVVGAIQNVTAGSALTLSDTAGSRFAVSGGNIVAGATSTDYETATTHNITIVETLTGATGSPKSTTVAITVTNVFEQPNLAALTFSSSTFITGVSSSGTILSATATSTITASGLPAGLTINGAARTWAWDGTGSVGSGTFTLTETLSDSANSPRTSSINYTITAIGTLAKPTLSNFSALGAAPLVLQWSTTDYVAGLRGQLQIATDSGFATITQNRVFFIDGASWALNDEAVGLVTPSGTYYARIRVVRDNESGGTSITDQLGNTFNADVSAWSTTFTDTISVSVALLVSTTGANKSRYANVATPFHQAISNNDVGSPCCVRASIAMAVAKGHFEFTINGIKLTSAGAVGCGITDAATQDFNSSGFNGTRPGSGSNIPGVTVRCARGATTLTIYRNGGNATVNTPGSAVIAQGDAIIFEVDTAANTVAISYYRLATTTTSLLTTVTMTGAYIPAAIWAYGATERGTGATTTFDTSDAYTFNPGYATFLSSASAGFSPYG